MTSSTQFPIGAAVTLADLEHDLHATLARLRAAEPVSWLPALNAWLVTRYDLTVAVMRDAKTYTVDHPNFSTGQVVGQSMLSLDGEAQQRHRRPFELPFRRREVERRFDGVVKRYIGELLEGFGGGSAELRRDYAGPIAVKTMIAALGLAETAVSDVLGWYDTIVEAVTRVTAGEPVSSAGRAAFAALSDSLLPSLRQNPSTSLLAAAAGMADGLSDEQIISNAAVLLFGGIETTEGMIANAFYFLLTHPAILDAVRADLTLIPAVVEESLRLEPAASVVDRYATCDTELNGVLLKEGELVRVSLTGANCDPAVFGRPHQFDITRTNLRSHVTFAQGPHVCLGIHLARLEAHDALKIALERLPNLRLVETGAAEPHGLVFRKPDALHVVWDTQ